MSDGPGFFSNMTYLVRDILLCIIAICLLIVVSNFQPCPEPDPMPRIPVYVYQDGTEIPPEQLQQLQALGVEMENIKLEAPTK